MSEKSDKHLLKILTQDRETYVPAAIEAAESEFRKRFPGEELPIYTPPVKEIEEETVFRLDRTQEADYVPVIESLPYTIADTLPKDELWSYEGRISVSTYWSRWAICFALNIAAVVAYIFAGDTGVIIATLIIMLTSYFMITQGIKRMHDVARSGWYLLIPLYRFILLITDGTIGRNKYGDDPKGRIPLEK